MTSTLLLLAFSQVNVSSFREAREETISGATFLSGNTVIHEGDIFVSNDETYVIENRSFIQKGSIIVEDLATLVVKDANLTINQARDYQYNITIKNLANLITTNATLDSNLKMNMYWYTSAKIDFLSTIITESMSVPTTSNPIINITDSKVSGRIRLENYPDIYVNRSQLSYLTDTLCCTSIFAKITDSTIEHLGLFGEEGSVAYVSNSAVNELEFGGNIMGSTIGVKITTTINIRNSTINNFIIQNSSRGTAWIYDSEIGDIDFPGNSKVQIIFVRFLEVSVTYEGQTVTDAVVVFFGGSDKRIVELGLTGSEGNVEVILPEMIVESTGIDYVNMYTVKVAWKSTDTISGEENILLDEDKEMTVELTDTNPAVVINEGRMDWRDDESIRDYELFVQNGSIYMMGGTHLIENSNFIILQETDKQYKFYGIGTEINIEGSAIYSNKHVSLDLTESKVEMNNSTIHQPAELIGGDVCQIFILNSTVGTVYGSGDSTITISDSTVSQEVYARGASSVQASHSDLSEVDFKDESTGIISNSSLNRAHVHGEASKVLFIGSRLDEFLMVYIEKEGAPEAVLQKSKVNRIHCGINGFIKAWSSDINETEVAYNGKVHVLWRLTVLVLSQLERGYPIENASIEISDTLNGSIIENKLTGPDGKTWFDLVNGVITSGGSEYINLYSLTIRVSYRDTTVEKNITVTEDMTIEIGLIPTPTPTPSPTPSPKPSPKPSPSSTPTPSPTRTATPTPSLTPSPEPTPSPTPSPSPLPPLTPSQTPKPTPTLSPTISPTPTTTPSPSPAQTPTYTLTPTPTSSPGLSTEFLWTIIAVVLIGVMVGIVIVYRRQK